jgi:ribonuclease P protein component
VVHAASGAGPQSRVGFVVSKAVGGAVVRNRVKRRLRHLVAHQLLGSPTGLDVVVRALPASATTPARVEGDLSSAWAQARQRLSPGSTRVSP